MLETKCFAPHALVRVCATCGNGINVDEERENGGLKK